MSKRVASARRPQERAPALIDRLLQRLLAAAERRFVGALTEVKTDEPIAALTFDDGPHPIYTPALLDILQKHVAQATFFMVGTAATAQPAIVRQVAQAGHAIGNHSWDHPSFLSIRSPERRR